MNEPTEVRVYDKVRTYYKENKVLGGLIKWHKEVKTDRIGTELHIFAQLDEFDRVYLNDREISPNTELAGLNG